MTRTMYRGFRLAKLYATAPLLCRHWKVPVPAPCCGIFHLPALHLLRRRRGRCVLLISSSRRHLSAPLHVCWSTWRGQNGRRCCWGCTPRWAGHLSTMSVRPRSRCGSGWALGRQAAPSPARQSCAQRSQRYHRLDTAAISSSGAVPKTSTAPSRVDSLRRRSRDDVIATPCG